jgi:hypothetical protein
MPLGPHVPVWQALREELEALVKPTPDGLLAAVVDESNVLWCWSTTDGILRDRYDEVVELTDRFHATEIAPLSFPLDAAGGCPVRAVRSRSGTRMTLSRLPASTL